MGDTSKRFPDYDPACRTCGNNMIVLGIYDHILAMAETSRHYVPTAITTASCIAKPLGQWNANRSDERAQLRPKTLRPDIIDAIVSLPMMRQDRFSEASQDIHNASAGSAFIYAPKARLIRMYQEWYETLEIADLVGDDDTAAEVHGDTDR